MLKDIHDRTIELKEEFRWAFYPKLSITQIHQSAGLDRETVQEYLNDLEGILTLARGYPSENGSHKKWE